jgi:hypothetical protein
MVKTLYKGKETVVVDVGSSAEEHWKNEGYKEEKPTPRKKAQPKKIEETSTEE